MTTTRTIPPGPHSNENVAESIKPSSKLPPHKSKSRTRNNSKNNFSRHDFNPNPNPRPVLKKNNKILSEAINNDTYVSPSLSTLYHSITLGLGYPNIILEHNNTDSSNSETSSLTDSLTEYSSLNNNQTHDNNNNININHIHIDPSHIPIDVDIYNNKRHKTWINDNESTESINNPNDNTNDINNNNNDHDDEKNSVVINENDEDNITQHQEESKEPIINNVDNSLENHLYFPFSNNQFQIQNNQNNNINNELNNNDDTNNVNEKHSDETTNNHNLIINNYNYEYKLSLVNNNLNLINDDDKLISMVNSFEFVSRVICMIHSLWGNNPNVQLPSGSGHSNEITVFHTSEVPSLDIADYFLRIFFYSQVATEAMIQALLFLNSCLCEHPDMIINCLNVHRLFLTALTISVKMHHDVHYNNGCMARIGGVPVKELNIMEREFLLLIGFNLIISRRIYCSFIMQILTCEPRSPSIIGPGLSYNHISSCSCKLEGYDKQIKIIIQKINNNTKESLHSFTKKKPI